MLMFIGYCLPFYAQKLFELFTFTVINTIIKVNFIWATFLNLTQAKGNLYVYPVL